MKKKLVVSITIAALSLWWAVSGVDWNETGQSFRTVQVAPLFWVFFFMVATYLFRSIRWHLILKPIQPIPVRELFVLNGVGFLAIVFFPLRLGEFTRPILLKQRHGIPFSTGLATIVVERVLDGLTAVFALILGLFSLRNISTPIPYIHISGENMAIAALVILLPLFSFMILTVVQKNLAMEVVQKCVRVVPSRWRGRLLELSEKIFAGFQALPNLQTMGLLFLLSCGVWGSMAIAYRLGFKAFGLDLPLFSPLTLLGIVAVGISLPQAPGFVGTYQVFVEAGLALYGISKEVGFAYSVVIHSLNLLCTILMGLIGLAVISTKMSTLYRAVKTPAA